MQLDLRQPWKIVRRFEVAIAPSSIRQKGQVVCVRPKGSSRLLTVLDESPRRRLSNARIKLHREQWVLEMSLCVRLRIVQIVSAVCRQAAVQSSMFKVQGKRSPFQWFQSFKSFKPSGG